MPDQEGMLMNTRLSKCLNASKEGNTSGMKEWGKRAEKLCGLCIEGQNILQITQTQITQRWCSSQ